MKEYHKIDSVYKRDERGKFILGEWATPEFEYLKDCLWNWTEKIDGTNIRIMYDGKDIRYGGKTDNAQIPTKLLNWLSGHVLSDGDSLAFSPFTFHEMFGGEGNICLYGEGYGAGIQKGGGNYSKEQEFILFDVKIGEWWLNRTSILDIAQKLNLDVVPEYNKNPIPLREMISEMIVAISEGRQPLSNIGTAHIEGWVGTPVVPLYTRKGERIITKLKYKDFR